MGVFEDLLLGHEVHIVNHNLLLQLFLPLNVLDLSLLEQQVICPDLVPLQHVWERGIVNQSIIELFEGVFPGDYMGRTEQPFPSFVEEGRITLSIFL